MKRALLVALMLAGCTEGDPVAPPVKPTCDTSTIVGDQIVCVTITVHRV